MLGHFPQFSVLHSCNSFRPSNEIERLHYHNNLIPPLFLWSISMEYFHSAMLPLEGAAWLSGQGAGLQIW